MAARATMARSVGARELKTRLGRYLRMVQQGVRIVVTERGRPVAEILQLRRAPEDLDARLEAMEDAGELTRAEGRALSGFEPVRVRGGSLSDTLVEQRGDRL